MPIRLVKGRGEDDFAGVMVIQGMLGKNGDWRNDIEPRISANLMAASEQ
jgi:hypothetical protein